MTNLIDALQSELAEKSFAKIGAATGISTASLHGYSKGIGEPSTAVLEKLADYFQVEISYLRGESIYSHLSGSNKLDVARRFHRNVKEREVFEKFVTERMQQIADGDKSNKAHVAYTLRMEALKAAQAVERENLFKPLDEAFQRIPVELRKEALLRLAEQIR